MTASVIVLSWNGAEFLPDCLNHLFRQDYPDFEVIVVDNGSTDGSPDLVSSQFPAARLIRNERNLGVAAGSNIGLAAASGDVLVLLNQDTRVRPDWLTHLVRGVTSDPGIGIGGCKALFADGQTIQHAGGIIRRPLAIADHWGHRQPDDGRWDQQAEVDFVTGAAIAFRRNVLEAIGLLDEGFYPAYYEDADLCTRARQAGYRITYFPRATLIHLESTSLGRHSPAYLQHMHRSRLRYLLKHADPSTFLNGVIPAERRFLCCSGIADERTALWSAYRDAWGQLTELLKADLFVAASQDEWSAVQGRVEVALEELREVAFQGPVTPQPPSVSSPALADYHRDRLRGALRQSTPKTLVAGFIPAESTRWAAEPVATQHMLTELYQQLDSELGKLLPAACASEKLLAQLVWNRQLAHDSETPSTWSAEINHLRSRLDALGTAEHFREHVFVSSVPLVGRLIAGLRTIWYNVAARWAFRALANQQQAFNREVNQILDTVERVAIENDRAIAQLKRRVVILERNQPGIH